MGVGTTLKELLKERNMTAKELSKETGISVNTIYGIFQRDNDSIKPEFLFKIASVLNVPPESILEHAKKSSTEYSKTGSSDEVREPRPKNNASPYANTDAFSKSREMDRLLDGTNYHIQRAYNDTESEKEEFIISDLLRGIKITINGDELLELYRNMQSVFGKLLDNTMVESFKKRFSDTQPETTASSAETADQPQQKNPSS